MASQHEEIGVVGADGYFVRRDATVWSRRTSTGTTDYTMPPKPIAIYRIPYGMHYSVFCVRPTPNGKVKCLYLHRVVHEAFIGPIPEGMEVRHLDGNTLNNTPDNLSCGTHQENMDDRSRHGTTRKGNGCHQTKLRDENVPGIHILYRAGLTQREVGQAFGLNQVTVGRILRGEIRKHLYSAQV